MKLLRHGEFGNEKPGIIDHEGKIRDLSSHIPDINGNSINSESLKKKLSSSIQLTSLPLVIEIFLPFNSSTSLSK